MIINIKLFEIKHSWRFHLFQSACVTVNQLLKGVAGFVPDLIPLNVTTVSFSLYTLSSHLMSMLYSFMNENITFLQV